MKRSFQKFEAKLEESGLRKRVETRAQKLYVSLRDLYEGPDLAPSTSTARRAVYRWLSKEGKSINEIARLFDRAPNSIWKMLQPKRRKANGR